MDDSLGNSQSGLIIDETPKQIKEDIVISIVGNTKASFFRKSKSFFIEPVKKSYIPVSDHRYSGEDRFAERQAGLIGEFVIDSYKRKISPKKTINIMLQKLAKIEKKQKKAKRERVMKKIRARLQAIIKEYMSKENGDIYEKSILDNR